MEGEGAIGAASEGEIVEGVKKRKNIRTVKPRIVT